MNFRKLFAVLAIIGFVAGCAQAVPDDGQSDSSDDGYEAVETGGSGEKADNIGGREVAWKATDEVNLEGTTHKGTAEIVTTDPKVRVKTEGIIVNASEYPVEIDIKADEGLVSSKEMNFVIYARANADRDWTQLDFVYTREVETCVCSESRCNTMAAASTRCQGTETRKTTYWKFTNMTIENDVIAFDNFEFTSQLKGRDSFQLRIVPLPYGKIGDMKGSYDYKLSVKCFGEKCSADGGGWESH
ncbi:MAG: hypothetical protein ABEN55_07355 [Bradymonadaceae bacterium]